MSDLYMQLSEPFPPEMEKTLNKGGTRLTYIPVSEVITRLNRVFGIGGWSSTIVYCKRDELDPDYVVASVMLNARIGGDDRTYGGWVSHEGIGGQKIKRTKSGDIVDLGDEMKGAVSDALKKAAQHFGIGLYLARDIDAIEMEHAQYADEGEPEPQNEIEEAYGRFMGIREKFDDKQVKELRDWWHSYSGGRPVPKPNEFTKEEIDQMIVQAIAISVGGTVVVKGDSEEGED
jgi:hypothetical protein